MSLKTVSNTMEHSSASLARCSLITARNFQTGGTPEKKRVFFLNIPRNSSTGRQNLDQEGGKRRGNGGPLGQGLHCMTIRRFFQAPSVFSRSQLADVSSV